MRVSVVTRFIPQRKVLTKFFELLCVYHKIKNYTQLLREEKVIKSNTIQGKIHEKKHEIVRKIAA